jgi:hypothetical protein
MSCTAKELLQACILTFRQHFYVKKSRRFSNKQILGLLHIAVGDTAGHTSVKMALAKFSLAMAMMTPSYVTLKVSWLRVMPSGYFLTLDTPGRLSGTSPCERCFLNGSVHAIEEAFFMVVYLTFSVFRGSDGASASDLFIAW